LYETAENQTSVQEDYVEVSGDFIVSSPRVWRWLLLVLLLAGGGFVLWRAFAQEVSHPHLQQLRTASSSGWQ